MSDAISKLESWDVIPRRLDRDWAVAWRRAEKKFSKCMTEPNPSSRAAAVVLELWLNNAGPYKHEVTRKDLQHWLDEIYAGRCRAKLSADGRVTAQELRNRE